MSQSKTFTVSQVSKIAGVSIKTLHHYDEKGLLVPNRQQDNGYRVYSQNHLIRLQQILIYRELDFSIDDIKALLNAEQRNLLQLLAEQKALLIDRQHALSKMINSLESTMDSIKGKQNFDILFEDIPKEKTERWDDMARARIGEAQIADSMAAFAGIPETEMRKMKAESDRITKAFAATIGKSASDEAVQRLTQEHYDLANRMVQLVAQSNGDTDVPNLGYQDYVLMADSVDDQEVNELCEYYGDGYAEHARQAMLYFAEKHLRQT